MQSCIPLGLVGKSEIPLSRKGSVTYKQRNKTDERETLSFFPEFDFFLFILRILKYFITDENYFKLDNLYFMYDFI